MSVREQVRERIRAELAKLSPIDDARRPLELIAETSVRFDEAANPPTFQIVDDEGRPRRVRRNGEEVDFTIGDLAAELRAEHPTLFGPPSTESSAADTPGAPSSLAGSPGENRGEAPTRDKESRDWLQLGSEAALAGTGSSFPRWGSRAAAALRGLELARGKGFRAVGHLATQWRATWGGFTPKRRGFRAVATPAHDAPRVADPMEARAGRIGAAASPSSRWVLLSIAGISALLIAASLAGRSGAPPPDPETAGRSAAAADTARPLVATGSVSASERAPSSGPVPPGGSAETAVARAASADPGISAGADESGSLAGPAEVLDTATLRIGDKVVRLFGVEWARGGHAEDLTRYLDGRPVSCRPTDRTGSYRCRVAGHDLSEVVLFNGGGRASSDAPPDLVAAESHARSEKTGVWRK